MTARDPIGNGAHAAMLRRPRRLAWHALAAAIAIGATGRLPAIEPVEWRYQQDVPVAEKGLVRVPLPPETLDAAKPAQEDLRLLDPNGREVPYALLRTAPPRPEWKVPASLRTNVEGDTTTILIATGTAAPIEAVALEIPVASFLKPARIEVSDDGSHWSLVASGVPIFRQGGAAHTRLPLQKRAAAHVRITLDDSRTPAVAIAGGRLLLAPRDGPEPQPVDVKIAHREEFAGETVLTLELAASHLPLTSLRIETPEPLFTRPVEIAVREMREGEPAERVIATGSLYRITGEGLTEAARLDLPVRATVPARELLVHISNGDSPPLRITGVAGRWNPPVLVFSAAQQGNHLLLSGRSDAAAPRYDVAGFARQLSEAGGATVAPGPLVEHRGYKPPPALADIPLTGAPLDAAHWKFRKPVRIEKSGVQRVELDPEALAHARSDLSDLRLVHDGVQVPYLIERSHLLRAREFVPEAAPEPKHPEKSRWALALPFAGLPVVRLTFHSPTPLFQRQLQVWENVTDERGYVHARPLGSAVWSRRPDESGMFTLALQNAPASARLFVETDNGDNPAIELPKVAIAWPVVRLYFKADSTPALGLLYGNTGAVAPRYDLDLVADRLLASEKSIATLGPESAISPSAARDLLKGRRAGAVFWAALALAVVVLLVVIARLLPKK